MEEEETEKKERKAQEEEEKEEKEEEEEREEMILPSSPLLPCLVEWSSSSQREEAGSQFISHTPLASRWENRWQV